MSTTMQRAFIVSPSVNTATPLGRLILETAANQFRQEQEHIRFVAMHKAQLRIEMNKRRVENEVAKINEMETHSHV